MSDLGTIDEQLQDTKRSVALLVTCVVQEMEERHPGFTDIVVSRMERASSEVRYDTTPVVDRVELIGWVKQLLTGRGWASEGKPFLAD